MTAAREEAAPSRRLSSRQIEVFRAVMLAGSLSGAARELNVSQPSLTRTLRRMEDLLGFSLFGRVRGRLAPTAEGRLVFARVQHVQNHLRELDAAVAQIARGDSVLLRVGASPSFAQWLVPQALARLRRRLPALPLQFDVLTLNQMVDYLALGRGAWVLTMTPIAHPAIESRVVAEGRLVCVLPAAHPLAAGATIDPAALPGHPLIACEPGTPHGQPVRDLLGAEVEVGTTSRFADTAMRLAEAGLGLALVDEFTARGTLGGGCVARPLAAPPCFRVHLNRARDALPSRPAALFEAELLALLAPMP